MLEVKPKKAKFSNLQCSFFPLEGECEAQLYLLFGCESIFMRSAVYGHLTSENPSTRMHDGLRSFSNFGFQIAQIKDKKARDEIRKKQSCGEKDKIAKLSCDEL